MDITTLTPTGCLGYGFDIEALKRGMTMNPDVIAVDAGSTDPGPHCLGSGEKQVSDFSIKRELSALIAAAHSARIPLVIGSAGGAGTATHVDHTVSLVREVLRELDLPPKRVARIYADIDRHAIRAAISKDEIRNFEADFELNEEMVEQSSNIVAQMGPEPIMKALDSGAEIVVAGRACDDTCIAAFSLLKGAHPGLAIHMGKILECGAFSAVPFAMDVMLGRIADESFVLEPGSRCRRASLTSVSAHTLYERENPFKHDGPGFSLDLSECSFQQEGERQVRVRGSQYRKGEGYWIKLEGARSLGYRSISIAGVRCPTMLPQIDAILADARRRTLDYFADTPPQIGFHVYGRDGVMGALEPVRRSRSHELGIVMEVVADSQELATAACHHLSGDLLHVHFPGQKNTSGNLAFLYSPSEINVGETFGFSAYHLMKVEDAFAHFPIGMETV